MLAAGHIGGVPVEETLLMVGGPAALYLAAVAVSLRATRRRAARVARRLARLGRGRTRRSGAPST